MRMHAGFQVWDSVQALCSYVRGMLTSQAMLVGIGLGKEAASPTAAVFNFLLRYALAVSVQPIRVGKDVFTSEACRHAGTCLACWVAPYLPSFR